MSAVIDQTDGIRWRRFVVDALSEEAYAFLLLKWQLPPRGHAVNPPRPRTTEELGAIMDVDPDAVRTIDWELVDNFRATRRRAELLPSHLTVPIDIAPEWWDSQYGWFMNADGTDKPDGERTPQPDFLLAADDRHEIDDRDELLAHLQSRAHGLIYVLEGDWTSSLLAMYHNIAHDEEAQDRRWDQLLRPDVGTPH